MSDLDLALLGPPVITRSGAPVSFDTRKATAVLALLAADHHELSRERLAALLWPDADAVRARASLRRTLSVTAAAAGPGLLITRSAVALDPERVRVDVTEFEALAAGPDPGQLDRAVALYRDDFLAGFALRDCPEFDDWQAETADRLRQRLAGTLDRLVAAYAAASDLDRATDHARRWLGLDPLHEPAHQALIRLLAWTGQRSAALRAYRTLVRILDTELAVRPLPETTQLYDDIRAGRLAGPPAPAAPAPRRSCPAPPRPRPATPPRPDRPGHVRRPRSDWRTGSGAAEPTAIPQRRGPARAHRRPAGVRKGSLSRWSDGTRSCVACTGPGRRWARRARWPRCSARPAAGRRGWSRSSAGTPRRPGRWCWPAAATTARAGCRSCSRPTCWPWRCRSARSCQPGCPRTRRR